MERIIRKLIADHPNDSELGAAVRKLFDDSAARPIDLAVRVCSTCKHFTIGSKCRTCNYYSGWDGNE